MFLHVFYFPPGKYMLLCKGADSAILEKVNDGADLATVDRHLTEYAKVSVQGQRMLVVTQPSTTSG